MLNSVIVSAKKGLNIATK